MWFEDFERKILQHSEAGGNPTAYSGEGRAWVRIWGGNHACSTSDISRAAFRNVIIARLSF